MALPNGGEISAALDFFMESRADELSTFFGWDLELLADDPVARGNRMMETMHALSCEVSELANESGWKPWVAEDAKGQVSDKFVDEFADVLIFLGNMLMLAKMAGIRIPDIGTALVSKTARNRERATSGYRGRT